MDTAKLKYSFKKAYIQATTSIAFYPILIAFGLLGVSLFATHMDRISVGTSLINKVPAFKIDNANTARSLLSALLTGLISLVTFTFTMVMLMLSQVTSSFSPRLLPDLLSQRGNQVVLGTIIGSICFITVALSNIQTMPSGPEVPLLSVVSGVFMGFVSLIAFIYFIHRISNSLQIGNILNGLYRTTRDVINIEIESNSYHSNWEEKEEFHLVEAWDSGYFDTITHKEFIKASKKNGLKIRVLKNQGEYLLKGDPFLKINKQFNDDILKILKENVVLRHQENVDENFIYGFKHLTEIAVKALSPGVNDPGTAIHALDYISDLLRRLQHLNGQKVIKHDDGTACIIYAPIPFEEIFYLCTASIRTYSSQDVAVQLKLINFLDKICKRDEHNKYSKLLEKELASIEEASEKDMRSNSDIEYIKAAVKKVREKHSS